MLYPGALKKILRCVALWPIRVSTPEVLSDCRPGALSGPAMSFYGTPQAFSKIQGTGRPSHPRGRQTQPPTSPGDLGEWLEGAIRGGLASRAVAGAKKAVFEDFGHGIRDALHGLLRRLEAGAWPNFSDPAPHLGR